MVNETTPSTVCGQMNRPRSRRLAYSDKPIPSCQIALMSEPLRPRKKNASRAKGFSAKPSRTCSARLRMRGACLCVPSQARSSPRSRSGSSQCTQGRGYQTCRRCRADAHACAVGQTLRRSSLRSPTLPYLANTSALPPRPPERMTAHRRSPTAPAGGICKSDWRLHHTVGPRQQPRLLEQTPQPQSVGARPPAIVDDAQGPSAPCSFVRS